ncbi:hypothetical protein L1887_27619 [Cichorium endivia]|nr:hypothetical protein L1887_27619 [Cichorium endivia]
MLRKTKGSNINITSRKRKEWKLKERTYTAPQKWMRGKGHVTIQFGYCYNYATLPTTSHLEACQFVATNHKAQYEVLQKEPLLLINNMFSHNK